MQRASALDGFAALQQRQIRVHFFGRMITPARFRFARLEQDFVEFHQPVRVGELTQIAWQLWKVMTIFAGADLVKHLAQAVDVALRCARPFRRQKTARANK